MAKTIATARVSYFDDLAIFQSPDGGRFRGRLGPLYIPDYLDGVIVAVFGLDSRPQARKHSRRQGNDRHADPAAGDTSYAPGAVASLYDFPAGTTGAGQTIALIELGGGFRIFDVNTYFGNLGIQNLPSITSVSVDGAINSDTGDPYGDDLEVMMDIEIAGAVAPGANLVIYFAPDDDRAFFDAVTTAIHDQLRAPSIISISWGHAESEWTKQALDAFNEAFREAALFNVTVCASSGDDGSTDKVNDGKPHVDFPASSPEVLSCGGTRLESNNGTITKEVVWNDGLGGASGGGVSEIFALPNYQNGAGVPVGASRFKGRGVPDVSGDADTNTGFEAIIDGRYLNVGGTSAVEPLWAALIARVNEGLKRPVGFVNAGLYKNPAALHDIVEGSNGAFQAGNGWDACTGLGSPIGTGVMNALK